MPDLGRFIQAEVDAIQNGESAQFLYRGTVERDAQGTLAFIGGGWELAANFGGNGGGGGLTPTKIYTSDGSVSAESQLFSTTLDVDAWYQILLKNDRGLTPMVSGKFIDGLNNNDPVYVRGWLRGSAAGYLEFEVEKNGANIIFNYYGPLTSVNLSTNLEIWKFS